MKHVLITAFLLTLGAAFAQESVTLNFAALIGDQEAACGVMYEGVGAEDSTIELQDLRFYVSDVRLLTADGEVKLELTPNQWQHQDVALLDFEDGSERCAESGNEAMNSAVTGTAPAGDYTGLVFNMGVPFNLNHADVATAPTPLNVSSMWWSWQGGYKHARIDLMSHSAASNTESGMATDTQSGGEASAQDGHGGAAQAGLWPIHLGSTGCDAPARVVPPATPCANPNLAQVRLENFDVANDTVVADVSALLEGVDVSQSLELAPPGCMSGPEDPDCTVLFTHFGLGADAAAQTFFHTGNQAAAQTSE